ncbi:MAG: DUF2784 domain-containing protein [Candidatus Marinimicrobia bacterium]|nr:DUF2784 domain-containing protein [Candidatus Neomarinimicrobiota bacterium]
MPYKFLADLVLLIHFTFILFVVFGGFTVLKWRWIIYYHIPAALWGAVIEITGWVCPLTPLEIELRVRAGSGFYTEGFIDHYLIPIVYPPGLTRQLQYYLAAGVIIINAAAYYLVWRKYRNSQDLLKSRHRRWH